MVGTSEESQNEDQKAFLRARRTIGHLWHITRGDKAFNPNGCDGCKEIHQFLTDPDYKGDSGFPVGVAIDPDWKFGPDEMELPIDHRAERRIA